MRQIKKYLYIISFLTLGGIGMISCKKDPNNHIPAFEKGALATAEIVSESTILDVSNIANASVTLRVDAKQYTPVASITVTKTLVKKDGTIEETLTLQEVTSFPTDIVLTGDLLVTGYGITKEQLEGGDQFIFDFLVNLPDGRTLQKSANVADPSFSLLVTCPVDVDPFVGTYMADGNCTDDNNANDAYSHEVTVTKISYGKLLVSNFLDFGDDISFVLDLVCGETVVNLQVVPGFNVEIMGTGINGTFQVDGSSFVVNSNMPAFDNYKCGLTYTKLP